MQCMDRKKCFRHSSYTPQTRTHTQTQLSVHQLSQWQVGLPVCLSPSAWQTVCVCVWAALCGACWAQLITEWSILEPLWCPARLPANRHVHARSPGELGCLRPWERKKKLLCVMIQAHLCFSWEKAVKNTGMFTHRCLNDTTGLI